MEGSLSGRPTEGDIADTLQLRDVAMANIFWLSMFAVHISATRRIRLNLQYVTAMRPYVKLLDHLFLGDRLPSFLGDRL